MNKPQGRQSRWVRAGCRSLTVIWGTPPVRRVFQSLGPGDLNARLTSWMYTRTGIVEGAPPAMCRQRSSEHGHPTRSGHQPHPHLPRPRRPQRHHQSRGKTPYTSQQITTHPIHVNRLCRPPAAEPWLWRELRPRGVWSRVPEAVHGHDVDAILVGVAPGSGVQRDTRGETGPSTSRSFRSPLRSSPPTLLADLISKATTRPSSVSRTRSTSMPSRVRQCPTETICSVHVACARISETTNVSSRWPNCVRTVGSLRASLSGDSRRSRAATPGSMKFTFGRAVVRFVRVRSHGGSNRTRNTASSRRT